MKIVRKQAAKGKAAKAERKHLAKTPIGYNEWNVEAYADDLIACGRMAENCVAMLENHTEPRRLARIRELLAEALKTADKLEEIGQDIAKLIRK